MPGLLEEQDTKDDINQKSTTTPPSSGGGTAGRPGTKLSNGVVLGEDGKPCRTCTSSTAWMAMMKSSTKPKTTTTTPSTTTTSASPTTTHPSEECPPDVNALGRSTWTLLHTLPTTYPPTPTPARQSSTHQFITLFSQLYPCGYCATDFREYLKSEEGGDLKEALKSQEGFGRWMCRAHNAVNRKLEKSEFDCEFWRRRWVDGPGDGSCG